MIRLLMALRLAAISLLSAAVTYFQSFIASMTWSGSQPASQSRQNTMLLLQRLCVGHWSLSGFYTVSQSLSASGAGEIGDGYG